MAVSNLAAYLERVSDEPALTVSGHRTSWRELSEQTARWRGGLTGSGVRAGDRVAIVARNGADFVAAHLAAMGVGAISVPLNPLSPPSELARELAAVDPFAAFSDDPSAENLQAALALNSEMEVQQLSSRSFEGAAPVAIAPVEDDHPAALLFTSGTAGASKPAILTHGNLTAGLQAVLSLPVDLVGGDHVFLGVIPMFHVFGLNMVLHLGLITGGQLVLDEFTGPAQTIDLINQHRVTVVAGPPTLWQALCRHDEAEVEGGEGTAGGGADLSSVELAVSGAAKLPPQLKLDVADRFGLTLHEGYGLTESSAVVASTIGTDATPGSVGVPLPGVSARIVNDQGEDCLIGDPGELLVKGPMVFPGYWGVSRAAGNPLTEDGWLKTGDVALVDEDGQLAIVDRRKDLIIVSGFNVYPGEVESVIATHPAVADVGVVGEPSPRTGEAIVAFVVPEADSVEPTEDQLRLHCEQELARYKVPTRFVIKPGLPVGPTGKLQRIRLK